MPINRNMSGLQNPANIPGWTKSNQPLCTLRGVWVFLGMFKSSNREENNAISDTFIPFYDRVLGCKPVENLRMKHCISPLKRNKPYLTVWKILKKSFKKILIITVKRFSYQILNCYSFIAQAIMKGSLLPERKAIPGSLLRSKQCWKPIFKNRRTPNHHFPQSNIWMKRYIYHRVIWVIWWTEPWQSFWHTRTWL